MTSEVTTAQQRIVKMQKAAADLFASTLILHSDYPNGDIRSQMHPLHDTYFEDITDAVPINVTQDRNTSVLLEGVDPSRSSILVVANHLPLEKTVSPSSDMLRNSLTQQGRGDIWQGLELTAAEVSPGNPQVVLDNLPAVIARRALIWKSLKTSFPNANISLHSVGLKFRPPLGDVIERDGTIIVPFDRSGSGKFKAIVKGVSRLYDPDSISISGRIPIVVGYPEGQNPRPYVNRIGPFRTGIFSAMSAIRDREIIIVPMALAADASFGLRVSVLRPFFPRQDELIRPGVEDYAVTIRKLIEQEYTQILEKEFEGNYFWKGQEYPYGGHHANDYQQIGNGARVSIEMAEPESIPQWERSLQEKILPELEKGRKGWDLEHTKAVVHWIKKICAMNPHLDSQVLIAAAYAHDWGYEGLFDTQPTQEQIMQMKTQHMEIGAMKIRDLLMQNLLDVFTPNQINRVVHLVGMHDKLNIVSKEDEIALVEADTLGGLDVNFVTPTFDAQGNDAYIKVVTEKRRPLFTHEVALAAFESLLQGRQDWYQTRTT